MKQGEVKVGERDYAFALALIIVVVFVALVALQRFEAAAVLGPFVGQAWDRYFRRKQRGEG